MPPEFLLQMCLSALSIILTAIIGIIVKRMNDKSEERRADEKSREEETREAERARREEYSALKDGIKAILRDRVIQADIHFSRTGEISLQDKENVQMMYEAYHDLGGNDIATASYKRVIALPISQEEHIS